MCLCRRKQLSHSILNSYTVIKFMLISVLLFLMNENEYMVVVDGCGLCPSNGFQEVGSYAKGGVEPPEPPFWL